MKKISIFILSVLLMGTLVFIGCSSEDSVATNTDNSKSSQRIMGNKFDEFVEDFYDDTFKYGDSIIAYDTLTNFKVKEITVGINSVVRGYVAVDATSDEPLFFMDVNKPGKQITMVDLLTNEVDIFNDIDLHDDYLLSDEFDMIKVIDDLNNNYVTYVNIDLPKFWGPDKPKVGPKQGGGIIPGTDPPKLGCWKMVQRKVRRFFINFNQGPPFAEEVDC